MSNAVPMATVAQAAKPFDLDQHLVASILKKAKVPVLHTMPFGKGTMKLYEAEVARKAIQAHLDAEAKKIKPASAPPVVPDPGFKGFADLSKALRLAHDAISELTEEIKGSRADIRIVKEQNAILLKKLEAVVGHTHILAQELGTKVPA